MTEEENTELEHIQNSEEDEQYAVEYEDDSPSRPLLLSILLAPFKAVWWVISKIFIVFFILIKVLWSLIKIIIKLFRTIYYVLIMCICIVFFVIFSPIILPCMLLYFLGERNNVTVLKFMHFPLGIALTIMKIITIWTGESLDDNQDD